MSKTDAIRRIVEILTPYMLKFYKTNKSVYYLGYRFNDDGTMYNEYDAKYAETIHKARALGVSRKLIIETFGNRLDDYIVDAYCNIKPKKSIKERFIEDFKDHMSVFEDGDFEISIIDQILSGIMQLKLDRYKDFEFKKSLLYSDDALLVYVPWRIYIGTLLHIFIDKDYAVKTLQNVENPLLVLGVVQMAYVMAKKNGMIIDEKAMSEAIHCALVYIHTTYGEAAA